MLAVKAELRNTGLGREMKLFQRELAISEGFELIEWTFDPLEIKNAYFNLERLGAVVRRYVVNQYGITSSPLQGGLPSDRLVAEWWLGSTRVVETLADGQGPEIAMEAMRFRGKFTSGSRRRRLGPERPKCSGALGS